MKQTANREAMQADEPPMNPLRAASASKWDVFISHASEDKNSIAAPLAEALRAAGLAVWFDGFTLTVGDSLGRMIDNGLAHSRFGIVVLSEAFFGKHWARIELDGLFARESDGEKVVLPVWHGIGESRVRSHSPILANRVAVSSSRGLDHVVQELLKVLKADGGVTEAGAAPKMTSSATLSTELDRAISFIGFEGPELIDAAKKVLSLAKDTGHVALFPGDTSAKSRAGAILVKVGALVRVNRMREGWVKYRITPSGEVLLTRLLALSLGQSSV